MSNIPGIKVFSPIDSYTVQKVIREYLSSPSPTYLRLTGIPGEPAIDYDSLKEESLDFRLLSASDSDIAIISTGAITTEAQQAYLRLCSEGIHTTFVGVSRIDKIHPDVLAICTRSRHLFVVDESLQTGLLSALLGHGIRVPATFLGHPNTYQTVGSYNFMKASLGIDAGSIYNSVRSYALSLT